jgi:hypothetical protein
MQTPRRKPPAKLIDWSRPNQSQRVFDPDSVSDFSVGCQTGHSFHVVCPRWQLLSIERLGLFIGLCSFLANWKRERRLLDGFATAIIGDVDYPTSTVYHDTTNFTICILHESIFSRCCSKASSPRTYVNLSISF